jgi:hypothetical protein
VSGHQLRRRLKKKYRRAAKRVSGAEEEKREALTHWLFKLTTPASLRAGSGSSHPLSIARLSRIFSIFVVLCMAVLLFVFPEMSASRHDDLDELALSIQGDSLHTGNSYKLSDPQLAVLLDGLLERGLLDGEALAIDKKLYADPEKFAIMNRMNLLGYAAKWARDRVTELNAKTEAEADRHL